MKAPSISTLLGDATEVKQKRYGIEKMGRVSDGANRHGNSARLHALRRTVPPGIAPAGGGGGPRKRIGFSCRPRDPSRCTPAAPTQSSIQSRPKDGGLRVLVTPICASGNCARRSSVEAGATDSPAGPVENANDPQETS